MAVPVLIRDATARDADAIAALHLASWRSTYRGIVSDAFLDGAAAENRVTVWRNRFSLENRHLYRVRVAIAGGVIVGLACVSTEPDAEWGYVLDNLHVHPAWKARGIGRKLIADAAAWVAAQQLGAPMHLWVYEKNVAARGFYDQLGGVVESRVSGRASDGGDAVTVLYVWRDVQALVPA